MEEQKILLKAFLINRPRISPAAVPPTSATRTSNFSSEQKMEQKRLSKVFLIDCPRTPPAAVPPTSAMETTISGFIVAICSFVAAAVPSLQHDNVDGIRVPTIVFKGMPSAYRAFMICIMFAFSGAFSALFAQHRPKIARLCRYYAALSIVSAVALLLSAAF